MLRAWPAIAILAFVGVGCRTEPPAGGAPAPTRASPPSPTVPGPAAAGAPGVMGVMGAGAPATASAEAPASMKTASEVPPPLSPRPVPASYFPAGTFPASVQGFVSEWYSKHLVTMREAPLLASTKAGDEALRFLWLRTWGKPIAVRVVRGASGVELTAVRLSGSGGYEPGEVNVYRKKTLDEAAWGQLQRALDKASYASTPTEGNEIGTDGAQWVIERVAGSKYRLVERWTPQAGGPHAAFRAACEAFLDLAGRDLIDGGVY